MATAYMIKIFPLPTLEEGELVEEEDNEIWLSSVRNYDMQDIGKNINRVQFVNNENVYFNVHPYNAAFKDIMFSGLATLAQCQKLETIYNTGQDGSGNTLGFLDVYGHSYNNVFIKSFKWDWIKARGACAYSIELIVIHDTSYLFVAGGTAVTSGIEACQITERPASVETLETATARKYVVTKFVTRMFDISISGTELISSTTKEGAFSGVFSRDVSDFTAPNGKTYKAIPTDIQTEFIAGQSGFQKFSITLVAALSSDDFVVNTGTIIESYSITDESARLSEHRIIGGFIMQKFNPIPLREIAITVITNNDEQYANGTELKNFKIGYSNSSGTEVTFASGWIKGKSISMIAGNLKTKKVSLNIKVLS